ncbi:MAG: hypothetical protein H6835_09035 [Planctomycetes bacterium]|nr:hypothetical protein [Planctomycetota bacterium]
MQLPKRRRRGWLVAYGALLVAAAIGVAIGLPRFFGARLNRNESMIIGTLKNISSGQSQLQASGALDVDGDGMGEYGFLGEMAGVVPLRGSGALLVPPVVSARFGDVQDGRVEIGGYVLEMFLPAKDGGWVTESTCGVGGCEIDTSAAETQWMCYAWPIERGWTGNRAFMINHRGDILATNMSAELYSGRIAPKGGVSGYCLDNGACRAAANTMDRCGNTWVVV